MGATAAPPVVLRAGAGVAKELSGNTARSASNESNRSSNLADGSSNLRIAAHRRPSTEPALARSSGPHDPRRRAILLAVLRTGLASTSPKHLAFAAPSSRPGLGASGGASSCAHLSAPLGEALMIFSLICSICSVPGLGMGAKSIAIALAAPRSVDPIPPARTHAPRARFLLERGHLGQPSLPPLLRSMHPRQLRHPPLLPG